MMMRWIQPSLVALIVAVAFATDEHSHSHKHAYCGTGSPSNDDQQAMAVAFGSWHRNEDNRRRLQERQTTYRLTVVFHEIHNSKKGPGRLSGEDKREIMNHLNAGFAGTAFSFKLDEERSTTTVNPKYFACGYPGNPLIAQMMAELRVGGRDTINMYFCNFVLAGYSTFPPAVLTTEARDGVVMLYPDLNANGALEIWTSTVHEVGHWLGLLHTFQNGCKTNPVAINNIAYESWMIEGDGVLDTAAHVWKDWNQCESNKNFNTCRSTGDPGNDPIFNFMNYITEGCMEEKGEFTPNQNERMVAQFEAFRIQTSMNRVFVSLCVEQCKTACPCGSRKEAAIATQCGKDVADNTCQLSGESQFRKQERKAVVTRFDAYCRSTRGMMRKKKRHRRLHHKQTSNTRIV